MALQLTINSDYGSFEGAYGRLNDVSITASKQITTPVLAWYLSEAASQNSLAVRTDALNIDWGLLSSPDPAFVSALQTACQNGSIQSPLDALKTALYLLLMQLPQYEGAVSV